MISKITSNIAYAKSFLKGVLGEFKHLKVPTKQETVGYLILVLIITILSATMFFVVDGVCMRLVHFVLRLFNK